MQFMQYCLTPLGKKVNQNNVKSLVIRPHQKDLETSEKIVNSQNLSIKSATSDKYN